MRLKDLFARRRAAPAPRDPAVVTRLVVASEPSVSGLAAAPPRSASAPAPRQPAARMTTAPVPRSGDAAAERAAIRAWAREQGLAVSDRGRLPAHVLDAYRAAH